MNITVFGQAIGDELCLLIGNYDGVHKGHQFVIAQARKEAFEGGFKTAVLSFSPHPLRILAPQKAPKLIQNRDQKLALLEHHGVDHYIELPFDQALASTSPEAFVEQMCCAFKIRRLYVGQDFRFGNQRAGDIQMLHDLAPKYGYVCMAVPEVKDKHGTLSSSRLRHEIAQGHMSECHNLLGRPFFVTGTIVAGAKLGSDMGFPTANLEIDSEVVPCNGVYATWMYVNQAWRRSITNIGVRPTLHNDSVRHIETHILDYQDDLYGTRALLAFNDWIRPEQRFSSRQVLIEQIGHDLQQRRQASDRNAPHIASEVLALIDADT